MKGVILEGREFNRLIAATKGFISKTDHRAIYHYIKLDVDAENAIVTAAACDGYRLSVERAKAGFTPDESFSCYIPICARVPQNAIVTIQLKDDDVLIRCEDRIFGCRQPKCKEDFVNYEKFFHEETNFRVGFSAEYLEKALAAAKASAGDNRSVLVLEFKSPSAPCYIKTGKRRENLKMVLPVRIPEGVAYENTESAD